MRTAVVVGAGIGGLAVSGALARTGWRVTLIERDDRLRAGRAALMLWPNGVRAVRAVGLGAGLDGSAAPVRSLAIQRPDGQWLLQPDSGRGSRADVERGAHGPAAGGDAAGREATGRGPAGRGAAGRGATGRDARGREATDRDATGRGATGRDAAGRESAGRE